MAHRTNRRKATKNRSTKLHEVRAADEAAEILIYGDIGEDWWDPESSITAKTIRDQLKALAKYDTVVVRINSPGGDAFEGVAIHNILVQADQRIVVQVDGTAISAASIIMMAGDERRMAENALVMVHDPWTIAVGNADDMREVAEMLDVVSESLAKTYVRRTGQTLSEIREMMAAETWMGAEDALEQGFATHIDAPADEADDSVEALLTDELLSTFKHPPAACSRWKRGRHDAADDKRHMPRVAAAAMARDLTAMRTFIAAHRDEQDHPPAVERGGDQHTRKHMDPKELQAALDKANAELDAVRSERDVARKERDEQRTKAEALETQNKVLVEQRDKVLADKAKTDAKLIAGEVEAQVGVKITAAERDTFVKLRTQNPELYNELLAQRVESTLLQRDPAGIGANTNEVDVDLSDDLEGDEFNRIVNAAAATA